jgi:peptidoglycan LD-endopeptidase LytH
MRLVSEGGRRPGARAAAILAVLAVVSVPTLLGPALADTKSEIAATERQIDALISRISLQSQRVSELQSEASRLAGELDAVLGDIARTEDLIAQKQREIAAADRALAELQAQLDQRAREVYQFGAGTEIEVLLGASSFQDFAARLEFVNQASRNDRDLFDRIRNEQNTLRHKKIELRQLEERLEADKAKLERQQDAITAKLGEANAALEAMRRDKVETEALLERLEDKRRQEIRAAELAAAARAAEAAEAAKAAAAAAAAAAAEQSSAASSGGSESGDSGGGGGGEGGGGGGGGPFQVCPVDPPRGYSNDFGAPRPGGRIHLGIDIFAPYGTPIRATFSGNASAGSNDLGGLTVNVYGGGGFTYNAHLSGYGKTGSVQAGDVIGYVGTSGNAQGKSPHNHFEWHPGNGGAVNPYYYLNAVC